MDDMRAVYQELYSKTDYGNGDCNRSPGVQYLQHFKHFLVPNVIDVGCGTGDTVNLMREQGISADGLDWVSFNNGMMVRDIREPMDFHGYHTAICIDVLEHIEEEHIKCVLQNLARCKRQVVTVHTGPATSYPPKDLHVTQWSLRKWDNLLSTFFVIKDTITLHPGVRKMYFMES